MDSFISSGGSTKLIILDKLPIIFAGEQAVWVEDINEFLFDGHDIVLVLILHTVIVFAIVAEKQRQPHFRHYKLMTLITLIILIQDQHWKLWENYFLYPVSHGLYEHEIQKYIYY